MAEKKIQPGVAYTKSGEKKISGSASTTPSRQKTARMRQQPSLPSASMVSSIKPRSAFNDQKKVDSIYRWK